MLLNQLGILSKYLSDVKSQKLPLDLDILRDVKKFLNHLSKEMSDSTKDYLIKEQQNISLMNLWSVAFKSTQMMNSVLFSTNNIGNRKISDNILWQRT